MNTRIVEDSAVVFDNVLAQGSFETNGTTATVAVDQVLAYASILTRVGTTFVCVGLTVGSSITGHAYTSKSTPFVNTGPLIQTRIVFAFIDINFTTTSFKSFGAITSVRSWSVDTGSAVLAGRSFVTFINVNIAFGSNETFGAIASVTSIDHARLTN
jgi:hypothetical protein